MDWIKKNKQFLSIRAIESHLEMPGGLLSKHLNGMQQLSAQWQIKVNQFVSQIKQ